MTPDTLQQPAVRALIQQTADVLGAPLDDETIQYKIPDEMMRSLREDVFVFSGFKTYHQLKEASELLLDERTGKLKSFPQFYQDTLRIREKYNRNWLHAEYNFAVASSQMAARWAEQSADADICDLTYSTAGDDKVRPDHAALDGVTLPVEDPFWSYAYPPNGWNCRCNVIRSLKGSRPLSNSERCQETFMQTTEGREEIFRYNPGRDKVIFPPHHPYYGKRGYKHCLNPHLATSLGDNEECKIHSNLNQNYVPKKKVLETTKDGHTIQQYDNVDPEASDYKQVLSVARYFASQGEDVEILPRMQNGLKAFDYEEIYADLIGTRYEGKTPDLRCTKDGVSVYREVKSYQQGTNGKNALRNMLGDGLKQSDRIILQRHPDWTDSFVSRSIFNRVRNGIEIREVWIMEDNHELTLVYKKAEG